MSFSVPANSKMTHIVYLIKAGKTARGSAVIPAPNKLEIFCRTAAMWSVTRLPLAIVVAQQIKGNEIVWIKLKRIQTASCASDSKGTISFDLSGF